MQMALTPSLLRGVCRLSQLARHHCLRDARTASIFSNLVGHQVACKSTEPVLTHTTLILQDGLDVQELPLVIRRLNVVNFPFDSAMYSDGVKEVTEQDTGFQLRLQSCTTVPQVLKLLEVPGDCVSSYSASFALHRLCQLQEASASQIDSFLSKAVLHELCCTVTKDLENLSSETLVNLVRAYLQSLNFEQGHIDLINDEVERRVGDAKLSIQELCSLIELLSVNIKGDTNVLNNLWIHLGSRYQQIGPEDVSRVYEVLRYKSPEHKYLLVLLDTTLKKCWMQLTSSDISVVTKTMCMQNYRSFRSLACFSKWLFLHIHEVKDDHMRNILAAYRRFSYLDYNVMNALERYISMRASKTNKTILAMAMDYCRHCRYVSPRIFDAVAADFQQNGDKYELHEITYTLRAFGHLGYLPPKPAQLFKTVEEVLLARFLEFKPEAILELLTSFVYLERLPVNFCRKVMSSQFLASIKAIENYTVRSEAATNLLEIQAAFVDQYGVRYRRLDGGHLTYSFRRSLNDVRFVGRLFNRLDQVLVLENHMMRRPPRPRHTPYRADVEIHVQDGRVVKLDSRKPVVRLGLLLVKTEDFCSNSTELMGAAATKIRVLENQGLTIVQVPIFAVSSKKKLRELLEPHLAPEAFKTAS